MPPIMPIILGHPQDAAWLYRQIEADRASSMVDFDRLKHYQHLLVAHLEGLMAAGETGREVAMEQWKGLGEFFTWSFLELQHSRLHDPEATPDLPGRGNGFGKNERCYISAPITANAAVVIAEYR